MPKPLLIIINGPPGAGKTTLGRHLASEFSLPFLHRDGIAETLFDGLACETRGRPALIGPASFKMLYYVAGCILDAGQSLILEGSFYSTALATAEFHQLQSAHAFEPFQIQCYADGNILLERFLSRASTPERHIYHRDLAFAENNPHLFLRGRLDTLALEGQVFALDTTDLLNIDYSGLSQALRSALNLSRLEVLSQNASDAVP